MDSDVTADAEDSHTVYAIDCEIVLTLTPCHSLKSHFFTPATDGKALTRVCVISFDTGKVVYDQLVKPPRPITDYLT